MLGNQNTENGGLRTFIRQVPVTYERVPYNPTTVDNELLPNAGTARANEAAALTAPQGTQPAWVTQHRHQTVLQQHCAFFDPDGDGVVWPLDTLRGFRSLGFNLALSLFAMFIIHVSFFLPTSRGWVPDPLFRVNLDKIHKAKHGSDTGTYDNEGRFVPQKFEDVFAKYANGKDGLDKWDIICVLNGQRVIFDPFGAFGAIFEWLSIYLLLWPEDGVMRKEDVRRVYDGSIFPELAQRRSKKPTET